MRILDRFKPLDLFVANGFVLGFLFFKTFFSVSVSFKRSLSGTVFIKLFLTGSVCCKLSLPGPVFFKLSLSGSVG